MKKVEIKIQIMKTLNLVDIDKSDIKYQIQKFPDGQNNLVINPYSVAEIKTILETKKLSIQIKSRLNNWLDLELIVCAVAALREIGVEEIHLYTPYIMGARSDRKFEQGGNNYLKDVLCPIINSLNFKTVTCIDPHSYSLECCIKNFRSIDNSDVFRFGLNDLKSIKNPNDVVFIFPDNGASKKYYKTLEITGWDEAEIIACSKNRDVDGKLTKTVVPITGEQHNMLHKGPYKDFIIIDDICDGGATFINIAKEFKKGAYNQKNKSKIYLIVTHGIFSKGFDELFEYFDGIYCTNSYSDLINTLQLKQFVKQLNVF